MEKRYVGLIIVLVILATLVFDLSITKLVVLNRIDFLNPLMIWIGSSVIYALVAVISVGLLIWKKDKRNYIPVLLFAIILGFVFSLILKQVIGRLRPEFAPLIEPLSQFSFPSGHAIVVFSVLAILQKGFKKISKLWLVLAMVVCFSRVYLGVHYLSDVVFGALFGYFISIISLELEDNYRFSEKLLRIFGFSKKPVKKKKKRKKNKR